MGDGAVRERLQLALRVVRAEVAERQAAARDCERGAMRPRPAGCGVRRVS